MRDKLKSINSVDESDFDLSANNSQDIDIGVKTVTFADEADREKNHLTQIIARLSEENTL